MYGKTIKIMDAKLTLRLNQAIIEKGKAYAKEYNTSLSRLLEAYIESLTKTDDTSIEPLTPLVESLYGVASLPEGFNEKEAYYDYLLKKHSI